MYSDFPEDENDEKEEESFSIIENEEDCPEIGEDEMEDLEDEIFDLDF